LYGFIEFQGDTDVANTSDRLRDHLKSSLIGQEMLQEIYIRFVAPGDLPMTSPDFPWTSLQDDIPLVVAVVYSDYQPFLDIIEQLLLQANLADRVMVIQTYTPSPQALPIKEPRIENVPDDSHVIRDNQEQPPSAVTPPQPRVSGAAWW